MDFNFILNHVRTAEERNQLIDLVEEMISNAFKRDPDTLENSPFVKKAYEVISSQLNSLNIENNREETEKYLEQLLKIVRELPEIEISIAVAPTDELINKIRQWADDNKMGHMIFNIKVKADIGAGSIIMSHKGEYGDYSLENQLNKYFKNKRQEIFSLL